MHSQASKISRFTPREKDDGMSDFSLLTTLELSVYGLKDRHRNVCGSVAYADSLLISEVILCAKSETQSGMHLYMPI